jgi:hypothetical protein
MSFAERYKAVFELLEQPLRYKDGITEADLNGLNLPAALHDYYLVTGNKKNLNRVHNRLLSPKDIFVDAGNIVFMEENQNVVYWGVAANSDEDNPLVQQGINNDTKPLEWQDETIRCAEFLEVMLFSQASFGGGLKYTCTAEVDETVQGKLEQTCTFMGAFDTLRAYGKTGCALSLVKWREEGTETLRLFAGFNKRKSQMAVAKELGVVWEEL